MARLVTMLAAVLLVGLASIASAGVDIDVSGSQFEILGPTTVKIRNIDVAGYGLFWADIQWDSNALLFVPIAVGPESAPPPPPEWLGHTELLKGQWHFVYTIISTWIDTFTLNNIPGATNTQGGYFIHGTDQFGGPVVAAYWPVDGNWSLLNPGTILIDEFFFFYTDGSTILPNSCYYQISHSTGQFTSCYALSGSKFAPADTLASDGDPGAAVAVEAAKEQEQQISASAPYDASPTAMGIREKYWIMKGLIGR
jgi:hypothetical protein